MRTKSRVKLALFAASQFHSRTLRFVCSTQSHLLFRQRNNMSTTTKLLKNSRSFESSNRKVPGTCPETGKQATFGSTFKLRAPLRFPHPPQEANGGGERDRTD